MCNIRINKADELAFPALRVLHSKVQNLHRDIAIVNAGLHYGIGGTQKYTEDLQFFLDFVTEHKDDLPLLIWKDTPPQHFTFEKGYYWCAQYTTWSSQHTASSAYMLLLCLFRVPVKEGVMNAWKVEVAALLAGGRMVP